MLTAFPGCCFVVVLCSHWSRGMRGRGFISLSVVTFARGVPQSLPLSALSLTCVKSSNNNNCLKMSLQEQWGAQSSLLGCPLSVMAGGLSRSFVG